MKNNESKAQANGSLILKEKAELETAPFLFSENQLPKIDKTKSKFHCTGERLFRDRPDVYKAVVKMLAEPGVSIRSICATLHVTDDTVRAVKERENISIAAQKKAVLSNITYGLRLASERVIELMPEASARDALIGVGILGEKMQLLSGDATARLDVDLNHRFDVGEELRKLNEEAREMIKRAKARVIDSDTDLNGENPEEKAVMNGDDPPQHNANTALGDSVSKSAPSGSTESTTRDQEQI
jgi:hypothetical protein